ncbi:MAG: hypothetical protein IJ808_09505 [Muribaculaceae bacterium]|nr:hypothetical protein [Muribaculaceae bacterium]
MDWICKNCGKRITFSDEQLQETRGVVLCPQCLTSDKVAGYAGHTAKKATPPARTKPIQFTSDDSTTSRPQRTATPPPRTKTARQSRGSATPRRASSTAGKSKTKNVRHWWQPISSWGCLWRTVMWTLVLLAAYIIFGFLMQGV